MMQHTPEYKQGYYAYKSWLHNGGDRPINPYDDPHQAACWYQGWEDASFE